MAALEDTPVGAWGSFCPLTLIMGLGQLIRGPGQMRCRAHMLSAHQTCSTLPFMCPLQHNFSHVGNTDDFSLGPSGFPNNLSI